jgi:hypothetical protein
MFAVRLVSARQRAMRRPPPAQEDDGEREHGDDGEVAGDRLDHHVRHHDRHDERRRDRCEDQPAPGLGEVALLDIVLDRRRGRPGAGIDARDVVAGALHGGGKIGRLEPVRIEGDFDKCMATLVRTSPTPVRRRSDVDTRPTQ